jgi:hypothetical protein
LIVKDKILKPTRGQLGTIENHTGKGVFGNGMGSYQSGAERFPLRIAVAIIIITVVAKRKHKDMKEEAQFNTYHMLADGVDCRYGNDSKDD